MSYHKYQATVIYPNYPAIITVEARNDSEGLAKLTATAAQRPLLRNTITRDGQNLREEYLRRRALNQVPQDHRRTRPGRSPRKHR